jgi:hypothetical protein
MGTINRVIFVYAGLVCGCLGVPFGCSDSPSNPFPSPTGGSGGSSLGGTAGESAGGQPGTGGSSTQGGADGEAGRAGDSGGTDAGGATGGIGGGAGSDGSGGVPDGSGGVPDGSGGVPDGSGGVPDSGGSAGTSSGGAGGTNGGLCGPKVGLASDLLISDLESGTNAINAPRTGYWFSFGDGSDMMPPPDPTGVMPFAPSPSGYSGSQYYARFTSSGGKNVGMGFDLNNCGAKPYPYDVSAYKGISFAYKSSHPVRVEFTSVATALPPLGNCTGGYAVCGNYHTIVLESATVWTNVTIPFSTLWQDFGTIAPIDKTSVLQIQFHVMGAWDNQTMSQGNISPAQVDLGVDSISFWVN